MIEVDVESGSREAKLEVVRGGPLPPSAQKTRGQRWGQSGAERHWQWFEPGLSAHLSALPPEFGGVRVVDALGEGLAPAAEASDDTEHRT